VTAMSSEMKSLLRSPSIVILCLASACATISPDSTGRLAETSRLAVVVEEVGKGSALEKAGLLPGDLLFTWERSPDPPANPEGGKGEIRSVFDWLWVKIEQAPRGTVRIYGERNGEAIRLEIPQGPWNARARPFLPADLLQTYTEGRQRIEAGDLEGGIALWDQLVGRVEAPGLRCWLLLQISEAWSKGRQGEKARSVLQAALAEARDAQTRVVLGEALGASYHIANETARAEASFRSALEVGEAARGESLQVAQTSARLGNVLRIQNRLDEAEALLIRALQIRQRWAPDSLEVADSLDRLAGLSWAREDLEAMSESLQHALEIRERWSPGSLVVAQTLNRLAMVAIKRGFLGDATEVLHRALAIQERQAPGSFDMAESLAHLGIVAWARGDAESAVELFQRALKIRKPLAPESLWSTTSLSHLGEIAVDRGDLSAAAELFQSALTIWEKAAPQGLGMATNLDALGTIARMRGDLEGAWDLHRRALEIFERLSPGSLQTAEALGHLGMIAEARGDLSLALDFYQRALAIPERLAPGTIREALMLQQLGRLHRSMRHPDEAAQFLTRAVDALESQVGRLGGSQDLQANFRARHEEIYRDAIELQLELGRPAEAFHLVERSRARSFLTLLSERDLTFSGELPTALERSRRDHSARYDQTLGKLARWTPAAGEETREALHRELSRLRRERDEMAVEIRKASPRLTALRQPQPLDLAAARKVLDSGTLALSYSVGKHQTALFAVTREGGLRVEILPLSEATLRQEVESFLERIEAQEAPAALARALPYVDRTGGRPGRPQRAGADPPGRTSAPPPVCRSDHGPRAVSGGMEAASLGSLLDRL
jgi:tetratricopeptide (TPR) repeat protein